MKRGLMSFNYRFSPRWGMTVLTLLALLFLGSLGCWQLKRAEQKKQLLLAESQLASKPATVWTDAMDNPQPFQLLQLTGRYLPQVFFLDNQHDAHQFGYHVISPLLLKDGQIVLVDRGWISGQLDRWQLPQVQVPTKRLTLVGSAYYPSKNQWVLGEAIEKRGHDLFVIEKLDAKLISHALHKSIYPFIIRLDKNALYGYVRHWTVVSMLPARHYGYALQWFAMALVVMLIYIVLNLKKIDETI